MKSIARFFILTVLLSIYTTCMATDWRFVANTVSRTGEEFVMLIDTSSIKDVSGKKRFWTQSIALTELDKIAEKIPQLHEEMTTVIASGYWGLGYMANPEVLDLRIGVSMRNDNVATDNLAAKKMIRDVLIRLAVRSEVIASKASAKPSSRILYEIDANDNSALILQYLDTNGNPGSGNYSKTYIPPSSPLETLLKIVKDFQKIDRPEKIQSQPKKLWPYRVLLTLRLEITKFRLYSNY